MRNSDQGMMLSFNVSLGMTAPEDSWRRYTERGNSRRDLEQGEKRAKEIRLENVHIHECKVTEDHHREKEAEEENKWAMAEITRAKNEM